MSNTITGLLPTLYEALDVVSREMVGFIPAVTLDAQAARGAVGQTVMSFVAPPGTMGDVTPGTFPPDDGDQNIGNVPLTINKSKYSPIRWTGEDVRGLNTGPGAKNIRVNQVAQSIRTLVNAIEIDCSIASRLFSRATGTAGTTPFASGVADSANLRQILVDNGAPTTDMQLVLNTTAGAKMSGNQQLTKANEAGTDSLLRQGLFGNMHGFDVRESAGLVPVTAGTGASYVLNNVAGYPIGATTLAADVGTGTILAGDVIVLGGDTNQYVVATALAAGSFTIAAPGLLQAHADEDTVTLAARRNPSVGFARSALVLATRMPALPEEGDSADDRSTISDPRSGLTFELALYKQYKRVKYELAIAWGVGLVKPEHGAILLG
jgi:hypothetical protein